MNVRLLCAQYVESTCRCGLYDGYLFYIRVKNVGKSKKVSIHNCYSSDTIQNNNGAKGEAHFVGYLDEYKTEELWKCYLDSPARMTIPPLKFAIRYDVDNQTFWDNNKGWDYLLCEGEYEEYNMYIKICNCNDFYYEKARELSDNFSR